MRRAVIRVLLVEDHGLVREGVAALIGRQADMEVVGAAASGEEALEIYEGCLPDVTLMDLRLPQLSGLDTLREILRSHPEARIIVVTMYQGEEDIHRALDAGAATYVLKDSLSKDLISVIREVHAGHRPLGEDIQARLAERADHHPLTAREIDVVQLVSEGMRNKEIAAALGISEETVQVHLRNIFAKLEVNDRTAALTVALRRGFIHLPE